MLRLALVALLLGLGACAQTAADPPRLAAADPTVATDAPGGPLLVTARAGSALPTDPGDPFEATNRRILDFNFRLDDAAIRPAAVAYRDTVGAWTRTRIRNVLSNLNEPAVTANNLLQGRLLDAGASTMRFVINSTMGLGGLFDLAQFGGPPAQRRDLGQTLAAWGVPDGPYLMLPIAGPSNPREFAGLVGDGFMNPLNWFIPIGANLGRGAVEGLDTREQNIETVDEIRNGSLDTYARLRSLWRQKRDAELGRVSEGGEGLDVLEDPGAAPAR